MSWAGVAFKLEQAFLFQGEMVQDLIPVSARPEMQSYLLHMPSPVTIVGNMWQQRFYHHLDAFLQAARSVPDVIQAWFGVDDRRLRAWVNRLEPGERDRRKKFQEEFRPLYMTFSNHPLSQARVESMHRSGTPPVRVRVTGLWGVSYDGGPNQPVPIASLPPDLGDPAMPAVPDPAITLVPRPDDFSFVEGLPDGRVQTHPLFPLCQKYLQDAQALVEQARKIADQVHGGQPLTPPPRAYRVTP